MHQILCVVAHVYSAALSSAVQYHTAGGIDVNSERPHSVGRDDTLIVHCLENRNYAYEKEDHQWLNKCHQY